MDISKKNIQLLLEMVWDLPGVGVTSDRYIDVLRILREWAPGKSKSTKKIDRIICCNVGRRMFDKKYGGFFTENIFSTMYGYVEELVESCVSKVHIPGNESGNLLPSFLDAPVYRINRDPKEALDQLNTTRQALRKTTLWWFTIVTKERGTMPCKCREDRIPDLKKDLLSLRNAARELRKKIVELEVVNKRSCVQEGAGRVSLRTLMESIALVIDGELNYIRSEEWIYPFLSSGKSVVNFPPSGPAKLSFFGKNIKVKSSSTKKKVKPSTKKEEDVKPGNVLDFKRSK